MSEIPVDHQESDLKLDAIEDLSAYGEFLKSQMAKPESTTQSTAGSNHEVSRSRYGGNSRPVTLAAGHILHMPIDVETAVRQREPLPEATTVSQVIASQKMELEGKPFDLFEMALKPPQDWRINKPFKEARETALRQHFDNAVERNTLTAGNASYIQSLLGLQTVGETDGFIGSVNPYKQLDAIVRTYPGRLKNERQNNRIAAMSQIVQLFTVQRKTVAGIEQLFKSSEAPLLLEGAIVESLRVANIANDTNRRK
jgi:hypothetical protein